MESLKVAETECNRPILGLAPTRRASWLFRDVTIELHSMGASRPHQRCIQAINPLYHVNSPPSFISFLLHSFGFSSHAIHLHMWSASTRIGGLGFDQHCPCAEYHRTFPTTGLSVTLSLTENHCQSSPSTVLLFQLGSPRPADPSHRFFRASLTSTKLHSQHSSH